MANIRISTDTTADIPQSFREELNITALPLTVVVEGKEFREGVDITPQELYDILDNATVLPTSSQVSAAQYDALYLETLEAGYTDLIHVAINGKGSGTHQTALISRDIFFEEHPEAVGKLNIHIVDSRTYSMAYGIPVIEAAQMAKNGASVQEILDHLTEWLAHARPMFVPLNLSCVRKSGRVSAAAAFLGDALGLKPLITFEDGDSKILTKARGENNAVNTLVQTCLKERKPGTNYALVYGKNMAVFEKLKKACAQVLDQPPIVEYPVGCVIAINTGPDMMGILYRT